ncbi:MAG: hypothetical protein ABJ327_19010 [Litoreibacter sp.]
MSRTSSILIAAGFTVSSIVVAAAEPIDSLAGTLSASGDYGEVLSAIDAIGAEATSLTLYWDDLQQDGDYIADPDWPVIAQTVYPPKDISIQLTFAVIDTLADRRPAALRNLAWDDPLVVESFAALATDVLTRMPDVDLISVAIGNEIDGHLSGAAVDEYKQFFDGAREVIHSIRPDVPVTIKMTWSGLNQRSDMLALARHGDALSITWYPMDSAFQFADPDTALQDMTAMATMANGPWELSEVGYPSDGCGASSPEAQARFHSGLTMSAATQPDLRLVQRVWSHDISTAEVTGYLEYYRTNADCFKTFLASLGLRTNHDEPKPAFEALVDR